VLLAMEYGGQGSPGQPVTAKVRIEIVHKPTAAPQHLPIDDTKCSPITTRVALTA